jgi:AhpD family alkylhydroperoxidase
MKSNQQTETETVTNQRIPSIDPSAATGTNKKYFDMFNSALGLIPNMARAMAQSPAVLEGYVSLSGALSKGSLGRKLGEELALTLAGTNRCDYCASAHTALGKLAGLSEAQTVSALQGNAEQTKDAAALRFANAIVEKRGRIDDADFKAVTDAGFTAGEAGEIVAHVALNVFTNYFNNVAKTEIDFPHIDVTNIS